MDVEDDRGPFAHGHRGVTGDAGEYTPTVCVHRRNGQVTSGRHTLPVRQHFLFGMRAEEEEVHRR